MEVTYILQKDKTCNKNLKFRKNQVQLYKLTPYIPRFIILSKSSLFIRKLWYSYPQKDKQKGGLDLWNIIYTEASFIPHLRRYYSIYK